MDREKKKMEQNEILSDTQPFRVLRAKLCSFGGGEMGVPPILRSQLLGVSGLRRGSTNTCQPELVALDEGDADSGCPA